MAIKNGTRTHEGAAYSMDVEYSRSLALISQAKIEHFDRETAFIDAVQALAVKKQSLQARLQAEQEEAQRKLNLKVAPINSQIAAIDLEGQALSSEFETYSREVKARIQALSELGE